MSKEINKGHSSALPFRKLIRLKGHDYSSQAWYFITICVQDKLPLYGEIQGGKMILNEAGQMVEKWYYELENKFQNLRCHEMIVMPDHFHCLLQITDSSVCPEEKVKNEFSNEATTYNKNASTENKDCGLALISDMVISDECKPNSETNSMHEVASIPQIIQWFKTMTTNEYIRGVKEKGWRRFEGKLWQMRYYDKIIHHPNSVEFIANYIKNNPSKG
jgi:REP element-mobilizing transposase RayT